MEVAAVITGKVLRMALTTLPSVSLCKGKHSLPGISTREDCIQLRSGLFLSCGRAEPSCWKTQSLTGRLPSGQRHRVLGFTLSVPACRLFHFYFFSVLDIGSQTRGT